MIMSKERNLTIKSKDTFKGILRLARTPLTYLQIIYDFLADFLSLNHR